MASLNRVLLIGNLTRDPEVRYTPSGMAVADLRMAVNRRYTTKTGENKEEATFVTVTVWDKQAQTCGEYLRKGSALFVEGRLKMDQWEKDGQKQSRLTVVAERVQFLGAPKRAEYGDAPDMPARQARAPESQQIPDEPSFSGAEMDNNDDLPF